jgi:hypothetical protein
MEQQNNNQYEKWAEEELSKLKPVDQEELFHDLLLSNTQMIHIDEQANQRRIIPGTDEWWEVKEKMNMLLKDGIYGTTE